MSQGLMAQLAEAAKAGSVPDPFTLDDARRFAASISKSYPERYVRSALKRATNPPHCASTTVYFREASPASFTLR